MKQLFEQLKSAIAKYRLTFGSELELQNQIAEILAREGIAFEREFILSPKDRPDFFIAPYAIEVKVKDSLQKHLHQMRRYNQHPNVSGTILICTKPIEAMMPPTLFGKPCAAICVGGNRL